MVNTRSASRLAAQQNAPMALPPVSRALEQAAKALFRDKRRFQRTDESQYSVKRGKSRSTGMPRDDSEDAVANTGEPSESFVPVVENLPEVRRSQAQPSCERGRGRGRNLVVREPACRGGRCRSGRGRFGRGAVA
jgi:hypothetical protein